MTSSRVPSATSSTGRSEEHTSELQSPCNLVCRLLLEKKKNNLPHMHFTSQVMCTLHPLLHHLTVIAQLDPTLLLRFHLTTQPLDFHNYFTNRPVCLR